jgi:chaperonin GroES
MGLYALFEAFSGQPGLVGQSRERRLHSRHEFATIRWLALYGLECQSFLSGTALEGSFVNLKPLGDRVVIEHVEQEDKSTGGVFLPDTAKEKPQEGMVRAVGSGRMLDNGTKVPMDVKVGDRVIYSKYSGSEIKIDGTEYLIVSEKDVLAIVDKVPAGV